MQYRKLGSNDVSVLGFGCMRLPIIDGDYGKIDEVEATKQLRYAIDNGLTYVDTAYPYHNQQSESFVGRALQDGYREKVFLATKLPAWLVKSRDDMDKFLATQLEKLQTDHIDYYLLHALNKGSWANLCKHDVYDFIKTVKASGKVRNIGFSFHDDYEIFEEILTAYDWDFCQIQLNYYDEEYQAGLKGLKLAGSRDIGVVIMEPLRGGKLAGDVPEEIQKIWAQAEQKYSPAAWAFRYLWNYPEVKTILSGMNNMDHIKENLETAEKAQVSMLSESEIALIKRVKHSYKARIKVDCTNCKYCMPCPNGVNIPGNFSLYNDAFIFDNIENYKKAYNGQMKAESRADMCIACGECLDKCPQNIEIIDELANVADLFRI